MNFRNSSNPNLRTLIIPDIHTKFKIAESIIQKEKSDQIIFLGDYFDYFDDNLDITEKTANWLKNSLKIQNRIHLLGNHDLSYMDTRFCCSGFSEEKLQVLKKVKLDLRQLYHYFWLDNWLCTHAGLSNSFYIAHGNDKPVKEFLDEYLSQLELREKLYSCGICRGGNEPYGGIVWCDYNEFSDIPDIKQIFGHTRGHLRQTENHICLDTELHNYAIYENKKMQIFSIDDL